MDRHIHDIATLIDYAYLFDIAFLRRLAHKTAELTYAKVNMHEEIAGLEFLKFLHRECHFPCTCLV